MTHQKPAGTRGMLRVRSWLRHHKLDRELAAGADPNLDPMLSLRAMHLIDAGYRRRLAGALEELATPADVRESGAAPSEPIQFDQLVERLRAPAPVRPQGVAKALLLITEGNGPLWGKGGDAQLAGAARDALLALARGPGLLAAND